MRQYCELVSIERSAIATLSVLVFSNAYHNYHINLIMKSTIQSKKITLYCLLELGYTNPEYLFQDMVPKRLITQKYRLKH